MDTIITRTAWCPDCYKAQRPRTDNLFVVMGSSGWHVLKARHIGNIGFTPHIFKVVKVEGNIVKYKKICSMHDCQTEVFYVSAKSCYNFRFGKWDTEIMTIDNWNALVLYKRDNDYFI